MDVGGGSADGGAYLLEHIIHDWGDEDCLRILGQIRAVMAPGARVLVVEQVIPPGNGPFPSKLLYLITLAQVVGGRERTPSEYASLLAKAGLSLQRIVPTPSPVGVEGGGGGLRLNPVAATKDNGPSPSRCCGRR